MIVRDIKKDVIGTSKEVFAKDGQWLSRRMLLKDDEMGFSFHETIIKANTKTHIHYQNHLEGKSKEGRGKKTIERLTNNYKNKTETKTQTK